MKSSTYSRVLQFYFYHWFFGFYSLVVLRTMTDDEDTGALQPVRKLGGARRASSRFNDVRNVRSDRALRLGFGRGHCGWSSARIALRWFPAAVGAL